MRVRGGKFGRSIGAYPFYALSNPFGMVKKYAGLQKQINIIKSMVNAEVKMLDTEVASTNIGSAAIVVDCINRVGAGNDVNARSGNSILIKHIAYRIHINKNATGTEMNMVRFMILVDMNGQGSAPTIGQVFNSATPAATAFINYDNTDRFWVLHSELLRVDTSKLTVCRDGFIKGGFHCKFSGTGTTTGDTDTNAIYYVFLSNSSANNPQVVASFRVAFYDN